MQRKIVAIGGGSVGGPGRDGTEVPWETEPIDREIVRLTGITDEDVAGGLSEKDAVAAFLDFAGDLPLVAHNAAFDVGFIRKAATPFSIH